ncbi:MAG TPA: signal peptidase II [Methylomirabilota bacterium]|nr:signal peptidase II [Methylomirabilota bacterium]
MPKKFLIPILILLDQVTKLIFWSRDFLLGPLHIHSVPNYGLIFSLNFGLLTNLLVIILALGFFIYYYWLNHLNLHSLGKLLFALILAGALSNFIDRLYLGYVKDFLDLGLGFTFNLADLMVFSGLIGILLMPSKDKADEF